MKNYILLAIGFLSLTATAQQNFKINAKIGKQNNPVMAFLTYKENDRDVRDSTAIKNGEFSFKGKVGDPHQAVLAIQYKNNEKKITDKLGFYIEAATLTISSIDSLRSAKITGSVLNDEQLELRKSMGELMKSNSRIMKALQAVYEKDPELKSKPLYRVKMDTVQANNAKLREIETQFYQTHPNSYLSLLTFKDVVFLGMGGFNAMTAQAEFSKFSEALRSSELGKKIANDIAAKMIGNKAPDFTQNDINGKPFALSSVKGKYVLVDFWASWCVPCRAENPNVLKAYKALKDKGLEIVGVSIDDKKDAWQKAVRDDAMPWTQLSDLKGAQNEVAVMFHINSVPQNFLIDPSGKIVGINLHGEDLDKKIAKLMKVD